MIVLNQRKEWLIRNPFLLIHQDATRKTKNIGVHTFLPSLNFFIIKGASLKRLRGRFKSNQNSSIRPVPRMAPTTTTTNGEICGGLITRSRHFKYTT